MRSHHHTIHHTSPTETDFEDEFALHMGLRLLMDLHGPAAVINYARDRELPFDNCHCCGWVPHLDDECLVCQLPINDYL